MLASHVALSLLPCYALTAHEQGHAMPTPRHPDDAGEEPVVLPFKLTILQGTVVAVWRLFNYLGHVGLHVAGA